MTARLAGELSITEEFVESNSYPASAARDAVFGTICELEDEGLLTVPIKETGPWSLRPTRDGRRRVAQWREEWERRRSKQDREVQRLILRELERQWRADPEMYKLRSHIDVGQFCEENDIEYDAYLTNAHRLLDQGKIATMSVNEATPASGLIHITETGRKALEVVESTHRPQRDAQEAWVEVARLKRRLQIAERDLPSLIADDELRRRCEDLLTADTHYDRVIREACVVLEDRVRKAIGAGKSLYGVSLMEQAFGLDPSRRFFRESDESSSGSRRVVG